MLHEPKIIGISGVAAAGKSTLIRALASALNATSIFWDDYEQISQEPADYDTWFKSDRNYEARKYDALENSLRDLKSGKAVKCPLQAAFPEAGACPWPGPRSCRARC